MSDTLSAVAHTGASLHAHDYFLIAVTLFAAILIYRFFVQKTADRRSKIDASDLFLDDTTRRVSWSKTMGAIGVGLLGAVLLQQALAGKSLETIYGIFALSVVGPIVARIWKGGEPVSPADYADPMPKPPPLPPPPVPAIVAAVNMEGGQK